MLKPRKVIIHDSKVIKMYIKTLKNTISMDLQQR